MLHSANANVSFHNVQEDTAGSVANWHFQIGESVSIPVTEHYSFNYANQTVSLTSEGADVYALKFPSTATWQLFEKETQEKLLDNNRKAGPDSRNRKQAISDAQCLLQLPCCIFVVDAFLKQVCGQNNLLAVGGESADSSGLVEQLRVDLLS